MNKSHKLEAEIESEFGNLYAEVDALRPLLKKVRSVEPDPVEIRAVATTLHSFYNGVERILTRILRSYDDGIPSGHNWHRELLEKAAGATNTRDSVLNKEVHDRLLEYLAFRHFFRHSYPVNFEWGQMRPLVLPLEETLQAFRESIYRFFASTREKG